MQAFAQLIAQIDASSGTNAKVAALLDYLHQSSDDDKLWCIALLSGKRPPRPVRSSLLRELAAQVSGIPLWLVEESYHVVGDLAETAALLTPTNEEQSELSLSELMQELGALRKMDDEAAGAYIRATWQKLSRYERFVFNKLITGGFRIGVSQRLMVRALARYLDEDPNTIAHRLMGAWSPGDVQFEDLLRNPRPNENLSRPYPFYLAYPLEEAPDQLGELGQWQVEYKWDGIRGQLICRKGKLYLWSRGEELVTERYPELGELDGSAWPDVVIDGEILAYKEGKPLPFGLLQKRIGRKKPGKKVQEEVPVVLKAYDLLEWHGEDIRHKALRERRKKLEILVDQVNSSNILLSPKLEVETWEQAAALRTECRALAAEGLMIKHLDGEYKTGRKRGEWWKWKVDPMSIDAVLIYAMRGHGRRANLFSDYTFAVWKASELVPIAKAYSGLSDKEMAEVDRFVKRNTIERFGPVRSVQPELVFELGFEGIAESKRHKSGIALRFPRMLRWRKDKAAAEANSLEDVKAFLRAQART